MTRIIWVKGHVIHNDKLAATIESIPQREVSIVKVESVQEAICELFEGDGDVAFIICDKVLDASLPQEELVSVAKRQAIPYLLADDEAVYRFAQKDSCNICGISSGGKSSDKARSMLAMLAKRLTIKDIPLGLLGSEASA